MKRRFFFHFDDGAELSRDDVGIDFEDANHAYLEAAAAAREMWPGLLQSRTDPAKCAFVIANDEDETLFRFQFGELMEACRKAPESSPSAAGLHSALIETHRRAAVAREELREGFQSVRRSLDEAVGLLGQLDRMSTPRRMSPRNRADASRRCL